MSINWKLGAGLLGTAMLSLLLVAPGGAVRADDDDDDDDDDRRGRITHILKNIPVTGALDDGTMFAGRLSIADLSLDNGRLVASGVLRGRAGSSNIRQVFENIPVSLTEPASSQGAAIAQVQQQVCDILQLDLGPLFLDLLGLQVDLSPISLDIDAVAGPGNLLGNLLCALAGLLDSGLGDVLSNVIQSLLNAINQLL